MGAVQRLLFICATNIPDAFDPASTRRFDLKIRFGPLRTDQRERLFVATLQALGSSESDAFVPEMHADGTRVTALTALDGLTAGDYASAARRLRLLGVRVDAAQLLAELEQEHRLKRAPRAAGFHS